VWFKRDDCTDVLLTGNKARKLEYVLVEAVAQGADTLVAGGVEQSNLCRVLALAAPRLGMRCTFLMGTADPQRAPAPAGNLVLSRLAGAELRWTETATLIAEGPRLLDALAQELRGAGRRPYVVPMAASGPLGTWGYIRALRELATQLPPGGPTLIVYPVASGGTAAGVLLGIRLSRLNARGLGVAVVPDHASTARRQIAGYLEATCGRFAISERFAERDIEVVEGAGPGYALVGAQEAAVIAEVARCEGIVLDPTYTAKAALAVSRLVRARAVAPGERVVIIHTGGIYGLFPQAANILSLLSGAS
jgi:D-cysteine desulfhydrase